MEDLRNYVIALMQATSQDEVITLNLTREQAQQILDALEIAGEL